MLHGSDSDVVWLQRDFGIYIVNLFDTGQAARVLGFPSAGLAYLLSHFCGVKVSKFPAQHACVSPVLAEEGHVFSFRWDCASCYSPADYSPYAAAGRKAKCTQ